MSMSTDAPRHSLRDLATHLGLEAPAADVEIHGLSTIEDAGPSELTFLANDRYAVKLKDSNAGAVIVASDFEGDVPMAALRCPKPRLAFAKTLQLFHPPARPTPGVHPTAIVPASFSVVSGQVIMRWPVAINCASGARPKSMSRSTYPESRRLTSKPWKMALCKSSG